MWITVNNNQNTFIGLEFIKFIIFGKKKLRFDIFGRIKISKASAGFHDLD